jgi:MtN3 and saliva related transmembrane protein
VFGITPDILGMAATFYGVGAAFAALLQARQMLRRRTSHDVSARFFAAYTGGYAIWLLYGVSIGSVPLIVVDAVGLCCGAFTLAVTLALRGSPVARRTWTTRGQRARGGGAREVERKMPGGVGRECAARRRPC